MHVRKQSSATVESDLTRTSMPKTSSPLHSCRTLLIAESSASLESFVPIEVAYMHLCQASWEGSKPPKPANLSLPIDDP